MSTTTPYNEIATDSNTNNLFVGKCSVGGSSTKYFSGYLDDIRLYNRALSYDEIKEIYNNGGGSYTSISPYQKALALFNITESSGGTIYNNSGNNKNITSKNSNLVSQWKLDSLSGSTVTNSINTTYNGTLQFAGVAVSSGTGPFENDVLSFDGSNDYITI